MISMTRKTLVLASLCVVTLHAAAQEQAPGTGDLNAFFKPVKWRSIGPFRGGRSVASTGVVGDPRTYYMGTTGGGLWKTDRHGHQLEEHLRRLLQDRVGRRDRRRRERSECRVRRHGRARDPRRDDSPW